MFKIPKYQLYLLQLENYELKRYLRLIFKKGLLPPKEGLRKNLVWTPKAKILMLMAVVLHILIGLGLFYWAVNSNPYYIIVAIIIWIFLFIVYCLLLVVAVMLLGPVDWLAKQVLISRAKLRVKDRGSRIKIIGIAGSYAKTTLKTVLLKVLSVKFRVAATPDSVNTSVGVARWILKNFDESTEIAIVEMGEHYRGDILNLCELTPPDIGIITGINEAHLERMSTMDNIVATIFEIAQGIKKNGLLVINADDKNVEKYYRQYIKQGQAVEKFSAFAKASADKQISNFKFQKFNTETLYWECVHDDLGNIKIHLLGEYALGLADGAVKIAQWLGMSNNEIKEGVEKIRPVTHRLEPKTAPGNVLVIDDAYNGNSDGAREAIKVLARFADRRKIYITPGLVETGSAAAEVHREIGRQLSSVADVVILIKNSVTPWIESGIMNYESGKKPQIIWYNTAQEAHASLSKILKPNDVILFQNDWGDQYL